MSSQNYWADNLRILQWMISDVNEEKTVLHDIKSSFCYHVLEQKYIPSSKSQTAEIISAILACDSDHEIWSKTTFDEKEQDCYIRDFSERFGIATLREMLLASDLDLVLKWLNQHNLIAVAQQILGERSWQKLVYSDSTLERIEKKISSQTSDKRVVEHIVFLKHSGDFYYLYNNELDVIKRAKKLKTTKNGTEKEVVNKNRYLYGALELVFDTLGIKEYFECQYGDSTYFAFRVHPMYLKVDKSMPKMIDIDKFEGYLKDLCLLILRAITSPPLLKKTITYADRFYLTQKLMFIVSDLPTVKSCASSSEKLKNLMKNIDKYYHEHSEKFDLDAALLNPCENWCQELMVMAGLSGKIIEGMMIDMLGTGDFYPMKTILQKIDASGFYACTKQQMKRVLDYFPLHSSGEDALKHLGLSQKQWREVVNHFSKIGCCPIPIPTRACQPWYPGVTNWDAYFCTA